ncbi:Hypp9314 [Branchiostoma lanceolatum]|uniref:Hypp9314 protein n=1 Tax=Branchiostoma lanceolatum TaxID=7740 RepID=A0A8S4MMP4_BRALA|nr:Hypp9314 [Branchiostoma lanceolatum]
MNFVRHKVTKAARKLPADFETTREAFLARIKKAVGDSDIPDDMVINWDQTGINIVLVGDWTLVEAGARQVPVVGHEDKRQITLLLAISLSGHLVPPQVLYQGKTDACHARFNFPDEWDVFHTESHWSNSGSMERYVDTVVAPYMAAQRERLGLANNHPGLAVFNVYKAHRTPGLLEKLKAANVLQIRAEVREKALGDIFKSAHTIVQETMLENFDETAPNPGLPSISNLMRMANRGREALRPKDPAVARNTLGYPKRAPLEHILDIRNLHPWLGTCSGYPETAPERILDRATFLDTTDPTSIDFELNHDHIPEGFLRADVWCAILRVNPFIEWTQQIGDCPHQTVICPKVAYSLPILWARLRFRHRARITAGSKYCRACSLPVKGHKGPHGVGKCRVGRARSEVHYDSLHRDEKVRRSLEDLHFKSRTKDFANGLWSGLSEDEAEDRKTVRDLRTDDGLMRTVADLLGPVPAVTGPSGPAGTGRDLPSGTGRDRLGPVLTTQHAGLGPVLALSAPGWDRSLRTSHAVLRPVLDGCD